MKVEIKVPPLGESIAEATISRLIKQPGSFVQADEEIIEVETDKVNQVLFAPQAGVLTLSVKEGDTVTLNQVIGFVDTEAKAEEKPQEAPPPAPQPKPTAPTAQARISEEAPPPAPKAEPTPAAAQMPPETPKARISQEEFVQQIKAPTPPTPQAPTAPPPAAKETAPTPGVTRKKMSGLRKVIAKRLVEAKNNAAMLTTFNEVDMSAIMAIRAQEKENFTKKHGVKLGFMSFFVKAVVSALKEVPEVNASIENEEILSYSTYDIGVAVSTDKGLMVPVMRSCDSLDFAGIEKELAAYAKKAREGSISIDDLKGGSFTITNGGVFGSLLSTPILNPPQSAILGMHTIVKKPVVVNDEITIRPMMYLALSYDHRVIDGKEAVTFLVHIKQSLEDPSRLLLDL